MPTMPTMPRRLEVIVNYVQDENAPADLERAFEMLLAVEGAGDIRFDKLPPGRNTTGPEQ